MIVEIVLILVTLLILFFCVYQGVDSIKQARHCGELYKKYGDSSFKSLKWNFILVSVIFFLLGAFASTLILSLVFA